MESDLECKVKPCYMGLMVILCCMQNSSYCLTELDGIVSNLCFAAFHLVLYHSCLCSSIPVMHLVDRSDLAHINADEDVTRADSNDI
jgi:hypothetical protein